MWSRTTLVKQGEILCIRGFCQTLWSHFNCRGLVDKLVLHGIWNYHVANFIQLQASWAIITSFLVYSQVSWYIARFLVHISIPLAQCFCLMSKPSYNKPTHPVTWLAWPQHPTLSAPPDSTAIKPYTLKLPPRSLATTPLSCTPSSSPPLLAAEVLAPLVHPQPGMATIPLSMNGMWSLTVIGMFEIDWDPEPYMVLIIYEWPLPSLTHASCVYAPTTKMSGALPATPCNIDFNNINHNQFLSATLKAHGLENSYQLTNHGPPFRIWWKGLEYVHPQILNVSFLRSNSSRGGRGSAFTIRTNGEFKRIQELILSKPPLATPVSVLYWEDDMVPFLISMKVGFS